MRNYIRVDSLHNSRFCLLVSSTSLGSNALRTYCSWPNGLTLILVPNFPSFNLLLSLGGGGVKIIAMCDLHLLLGWIVENHASWKWRSVDDSTLRQWCMIDIAWYCIVWCLMELRDIALISNIFHGPDFHWYCRSEPEWLTWHWCWNKWKSKKLIYFRFLLLLSAPVWVTLSPQANAQGFLWQMFI